MPKVLVRRMERPVSWCARFVVQMSIFGLVASSCGTGGQRGESQVDLPEFFRERPDAQDLEGCGNRDFVSPYAMTDPEEDFAETYAAYATDTIGLTVTAAQNAVDGCPILLWKLHLMMASVFTVFEEGQTLTYVYSNDSVYRIPAAEAADFFESYTFGTRPELSEGHLRMLFEERFAQYAGP